MLFFFCSMVLLTISRCCFETHKSYFMIRLTHIIKRKCPKFYVMLGPTLLSRRKVKYNWYIIMIWKKKYGKGVQKIILSSNQRSNIGFKSRIYAKKIHVSFLGKHVKYFLYWKCHGNQLSQAWFQSCIICQKGRITSLNFIFWNPVNVSFQSSGTVSL